VVVEKGFRVMRWALLFLGLVVSAQGAVDVDRMVRALAIVENSTGLVGAAGERGDLQFLPEVWAMYSAKPFAWAHGSRPEMRREQARVARVHVAWILARLPGLRMGDSVWSVALMHNAGYGRVRDRRWLPRQRDFAERVTNVYEELARE
jgi:hypothetical protein